MTEDVSVVMATYNGEKFLLAQLHSLASQTYLPGELVVADDGSTDKTVEIVQTFAADAEFPVRIIQNKTRLGYGENFLNAVKSAVGEFIAFCDQDDLWRADKLAIAVRALRDTESDLFVHGAQLIDENNIELTEFRQGIRKRQVYEPLQLGPWSVFYGFSMVFRRELLCIDSINRGPHTFEHNQQLSHDLWVYFLGTSLHRTVLNPAPLVQYRQHVANVTPHLTGAWFRRWTSSLGKAVDPGLPRDEIAFHRAQILTELSQTASSERLAVAASDASEYWQRIGEFERQRIGVYGGTARSARAQAWLRLARSGGYKHRSRSGLGGKLAIKDAIAGVGGVRRRGLADWSA